jgi:hypothetical protein
VSFIRLCAGFRHFGFLSIFGLLATLAACSPANFSSIPTKPIGPYICDPFGGGGNDPTLGLSGNLYYLTGGQPRYGTVGEIIANGTRRPETVYLNHLNVPTRWFTSGFAPVGGQPLMVNGQPVIEYFALRLTSTLKLGAGDTPGDYQFIALTDDGVVLNFMDGNPNPTIIRDDAVHPNRVACGNRSVNFTTSTRIPMQIDYFQGPANHIALMIMARKGSGPSSDPFCGADVDNEFYFDYTKNPPVPTANFNQLWNRNWRPLKPDNFLLTPGTNPCN